MRRRQQSVGQGGNVVASYKTRMRTMATNGCADRRTRLCGDERSKKEDTFRESLRVSKSRRRSRRRSRSSRHHANHTNLYGFGVVIASHHKARCKRSRNQEHGGAELEALRAAADGPPRLPWTVRWHAMAPSGPQWSNASAVDSHSTVSRQKKMKPSVVLVLVLVLAYIGAYLSHRRCSWSPHPHSLLLG